MNERKNISLKNIMYVKQMCTLELRNNSVILYQLQILIEILKEYNFIKYEYYKMFSHNINRPLLFKLF